MAVFTMFLYTKPSGKLGTVAIHSFSTIPMQPTLTPCTVVVQYRRCH